LSEKIKNELLTRKTKRNDRDNYLTAQKIVKNYREKQKSHAAFKRKVKHNSKVTNIVFDESREGSPVVIVRISG
jgi:hypothetical protein